MATSGWYRHHKSKQAHYFDRTGLSWCYRWRGHGLLSSDRPNDEVCKICDDKLFRINRIYKILKNKLLLKIENFNNG